MEFFYNQGPRFGIRNALVNRVNLIWSLTGRRISGQANRIFVNSFPKSGTHLLTRCLSLMPGLMYSGVHINYVRKNKTQGVYTKESLMKNIGKGCFVSAHLPFTEDSLLRLQRMGYIILLMLRDPRDIVVSQSYFFSSRPHSRMYKDFISLPNDNARIMAVVKGISAEKASNGIGFSNIGERVAQFMTWHKHDGHLVRYENLVGQAGGGSSDTQLSEIKSLAEHIGCSLSEHEVSSIANRVYYRKTNTFRKGLIGDWRNLFQEEHKDAFKEFAGQVLIDLGYETDLDW